MLIYRRFLMWSNNSITNIISRVRVEWISTLIIIEITHHFTKVLSRSCKINRLFLVNTYRGQTDINWIRRYLYCILLTQFCRWDLYKQMFTQAIYYILQASILDCSRLMTWCTYNLRGVLKLRNKNQQNIAYSLRYFNCMQ